MHTYVSGNQIRGNRVKQELGELKNKPSTFLNYPTFDGDLLRFQWQKKGKIEFL